jgi:hypothetical protein
MRKITGVTETTFSKQREKQDWNKKVLGKDKPPIPFSYFLEAALKGGKK